MSTASFFVLPATRAVSALVGTWLLTRQLPRRPGSALKDILVMVGFAAVVIVVDWLGFVRFDAITRDHFLAWGLGTRSAFLALLVGTVLACVETSPWSAIYRSALGLTLEGVAEGMAMVVGWALGMTPATASLGLEALLLAACSGLTYVVVLLTYVRAAERTGASAISDNRLLPVFVSMVVVTIAFGQMTQHLSRSVANHGIVVALELMRISMCAFVLFASYEVLYNARLQADMTAVEALMSSRESQYRISRETMDAINVKCHDIRHQIRDLGRNGMLVDQGVLDDIAREVAVYDTRMHTGNDPLDTVLTEKALVCEREGITFSCVADGEALCFLWPSEVYSLFGNALDNAIEASRSIANPERRTISLTVREALGMVSVHVENRFSGEVRFVDGMPQTSKEDRLNHGFGTKSMAMVVERHGGTLTMEAQGDLFCLDALIPVPK